MSKIRRRKAKKRYLPPECPKNNVFRRATEGRPYKFQWTAFSMIWVVFSPKKHYNMEYHGPGPEYEVQDE
jgi:hypothetical protein